MRLVSRADLLRGRVAARAQPTASAEVVEGPRIARIGGGCLSFAGTDCRVCGDRCEARAIRFRPLGRGRWFPDLDEAACTGCGDCAGPCPVAAIALIPRPAEEAARCA